jgi:hypothetical protein
MSSVNWDLVNLDEYVAMMTLAGIKPGSGQEAEFYGMDNITKTNVGGSSYSVSRGSGSPGVNAVDALQQATQSTATTGANVDTIRMNATQNATSLFPPAN